MKFQYLVTVIEKLMPSRYFSDGLSAAQADQLVLKELIQNKLPLLNEHLLSNDIDVTIVTFNWFLTLFIDALPTESMLRIIDVFLFEGRKVLFRVSLSILKLYERRILSMVDPVTIFQFIKEVAKHIFNVEELFKVREKREKKERERERDYVELCDFEKVLLLTILSHSQEETPSLANVSRLPLSFTKSTRRDSNKREINRH
uniref:Rab-GAP TBC domain-containing protein n=1 Tax=Amphimedon queenslandica TaxID=400682 RepID=A0A1X7TC51_AMPQE